jgi:uncharacterized protein YaaN involved in tellurite resistance
MTNEILIKNNQSLSDEEIKQAENLAKSLDIKSETAIMNFGVDTQKKLGDASTKILAQVKTKEAEEAGEALSELVKQIQTCDINQSAFEKIMAKLPLIGTAFNHTRKIIAQHKSVESNLDEIVGRLDKSRLSLIKDNTHLKTLYEDNIKFIKENKVNTEALKIKMREINDSIIPNLEKECSENPKDELKIQELSMLKNTLNRIDKKVYNLELFNTAAIQSLPRIVLIQEGNKELVENIQSTVLNVIPLWRNQIAEAVALIKQEKVASLQSAVYDVTNKLIKDNATRSKENTIAIAKQMERGIIDIETLQLANREFIATLDEVIKIKEEGSKNRLEAQKVIETIKEELTEKIKSVNITPNNISNDVTVDAEFEEVKQHSLKN